MRDMLLTILKLSVLGSVISGIILVLRPIMRKYVGRKFTYYIWLVVLLRLCLPFGLDLAVRPASTPIQDTQAATQTVTQTTAATEKPVQNASAQSPVSDHVEVKPVNNGAPAAAEEPSVNAATEKSLTVKDIGALLLNERTLFAIWAFGAAFSMAWYVMSYARLYKLILSGVSEPDEHTMDVFEQMQHRGRVRLLCSDYVDTPMLMGIFKPTIFLPIDTGNGSYDEVEQRLKDVFNHELTHYRHGDLFYKWFIMVATSLHWFNPMMLLIRREISRDCELACDESVIKNLTSYQKQHYGDTLLTIASIKGGSMIPNGAMVTTMCTGKKRLKERLLAIMAFKTKRWTAFVLALVLCVGICSCASVKGVTEKQPDTKTEDNEPQTQEGTKESADTIDYGENPAPAYVEGEYAVYEVDGEKISIKASSLPELLIELGDESGKNDVSDGEFELINVYERKSYEQAKADYNGDPMGSGWIGSIVKMNRFLYEEYSCGDMSGYDFFGTDGENYYLHRSATDVRYYRTGGIINNDDEELGRWTELHEEFSKTCDKFLQDNNLTNISGEIFHIEGENYKSMNHMFASFNTGESKTILCLAQPVKQGEGGVWKVVRFYDSYGGCYNTIEYSHAPELIHSVKDIYENLQTAADNGEDWAVPFTDWRQSAKDFLENWYGQTVNEDEIIAYDGTPVEDVAPLFWNSFYDMTSIVKNTLKDGAMVEGEELQGRGGLAYSLISTYPYFCTCWVSADEDDSHFSGTAYEVTGADEGTSITFYDNGLVCITQGDTVTWCRPAFESGVDSFEDPFTQVERFYNELVSLSQNALSAVVTSHKIAFEENWTSARYDAAGLSNYVELDDPLRQVGYCFLDIDNDGENELIFGMYQSNIIYEVYDMVDGSATKVIEGWTRNAYYLLNDNSFMNKASNSASNSWCVRYTIENGQLVPHEGVVYDANESPDAPWFKVDGNEKESTSEKEANRIRNILEADVVSLELSSMY